MGKPRMIILIRHAQSEGNSMLHRASPTLDIYVDRHPAPYRDLWYNGIAYTDLSQENRDIHQTIPDHRVKLTPEGWTQAYDAGHRLRSMLRADDTLHFFTSPYRRTRETTEGILSTLTSDDPSPSPFQRHNIKVYEEPRLREQDFGNFQPCSAEMERMWQERADYGHFFYRIPNGESAADAYDRISGFNESLWRQFGEDDFASVCVLGECLPAAEVDVNSDIILVTHGLMSRVFLMKWYHFSVEYFEDLRNVHHCEFLIMRKEDSGKYILENQLRTWSEVRREREAERKEKEKEGGIEMEKPAEKSNEGTLSLTGTLSPTQKRKQWGGCPDGCDHGQNYFKKEKSIHNMQLNGKQAHPGDSLVCRRPAAHRWHSSPEEDEDDPRGLVGPKVDVQKCLDDVVSSPDGATSYINANERLGTRLKSPNHIRLLRVGRDFGGSESGNTSVAGSDTEASAEDDERKTTSKSKGKPTTLKKKNYGQSGMGRGAKADALGDQSDVDSEGGSDCGDLERKEARDKSIKSNVY
jgi:broad specificity phosphatase PhoE